jgi:PAS domain S-box-containing protein
MRNGVANVINEMEPGEHICLLYDDQGEYLSALAQFHRKGLTRGDRCIHIADDSPPDAIFQALLSQGVDVAREVERGAILRLSPHEVYLQSGCFNPDKVRAFWNQAMADALRAGFRGLHVTGDVSWVLERAPGVHLLPEYEAGVDQTISGSCMQAICCYNRRLVPPEVLAPMFRTHSQVIFGDSVLHPDLLVRGSKNGTAEEDWLEVFLRRMRQSEDALREALDFKESLISGVPAGICTCDAEGRITSYNQTAAELWGTSPEIGDPDQRFCGAHRLYWPDGRPLPHSETPMARAIKEGTVCKNGEVIMERPDGSRATVLVNIVPLRDAQGKLNGAINCFLDITARKQAEAMLRQRNVEYRRLLANLPAAAYTCDAEGLITYYNPLAVRVWGRRPELNHPADRYCGSFRLFSSDGAPIRHDECWMALALQTGEPQNGREIVIQRPDGSRVTALAHAHPFHNEWGELMGAVNVLVDITARKQAEEALRVADRRKDEFLAMLSHELRNPLAPISNALHLLDSPDNDPIQQQAVDAMKRQMGTLTRLVNDLLDVSRLNTGRIQLQTGDVDLNCLVRQSAESFQPLMDGLRHQVSISLPGEPVVVHGDATRLEQVLVNLLSNTAKFTPEGGRVWLTLVSEGKETVLRVKDTGQGIEPELLPNIFDIFTQGATGMDRAQGGLGIGLALVKRLVEMHGGTVTAHS